jgi:iron uptake system EfeUOB component EfeO/EfeM
MAALVCAAVAVTAAVAAGSSSGRVRQQRGPDVVPVPALELDQPMTEYRAHVRGLLDVVQGQVATLVARLQAGDVSGAESAWLSAHLSWLEIGQDDGAYGAFGDLGRQIDGTAAGLANGTADPRFIGFHRVELDLWTRGDVAAAASDAVGLQRLVTPLAAARLGPELPTTPAGLSVWTLRAHEILEDGLRDTLTGDDEYGSATALASITADVAATREMVTLLAPVIEPRAPRLVGRARRQLAAVVRAAQAGLVDGRWVAISRLAPGLRERLDAAVGAVLETLAPIPDVIQVAGGT